MRKILIVFCEMVAIFIGLISLFLIINWFLAYEDNRIVGYSFTFIMHTELVHLVLLYICNKASDQEADIVVSQRFHIGRFVYFSLIIQISLLLIAYLFYLFIKSSEQVTYINKIIMSVLIVVIIYFLGKWYFDHYHNYFYLWLDRRKTIGNKKYFSLMIEEVNGECISGIVRGRVVKNQEVLICDQELDQQNEARPIVVAKVQVKDILVNQRSYPKGEDEQVTLVLQKEDNISLHPYQLIMSTCHTDYLAQEYINSLLKETIVHRLEHTFIYLLLSSFWHTKLYCLAYHGDNKDNNVLYDKVFIPEKNIYLKSIYTSYREALKNQDLLELYGLEVKQVSFQELLSQAKLEHMDMIVNPFSRNQFIIDTTYYESNLAKMKMVMSVMRQVNKEQK